jgi:hypothetical protein
MCPVCIATAAWIAAGATSTGGVSALVLSKFRSRNQESTTNEQNDEQGEKHE